MNPKVKNTLILQKPRERRKQNLFLVEGKKEIYRAIHAGYILSKVFICREIFEAKAGEQERRKSNSGDSSEDLIISGAEGQSEDLEPSGLGRQREDRNTSGASVSEISETRILELIEKARPQPEINYVTPQVYAHMTYRKESEGLITWAVPRIHALEKIKLSDNPLVLVIDAVEKPGNLGAILRTADAAGIDALIISDPRTDIYNPNVVRSSLGALFSLQIGIGPVEEVIRWLRDKRVRIFCTALTASKPYTEINYESSAAIVMGTEATGLSQAWLSQSDQNIIIPMRGNVDSMNVSVSAGIVLFEAIRQREIHKN